MRTADKGAFMRHEDLVTVGVLAVTAQNYRGGDETTDMLIRQDITVALAAIMPHIDAKIVAALERCRESERAAFRAKIWALPRWRMEDTLTAVLAYDDVLAIFDGSDLESRHTDRNRGAGNV